jgi:hypothetical protein
MKKMLATPALVPSSITKLFCCGFGHTGTGQYLSLSASLFFKTITAQALTALQLPVSRAIYSQLFFTAFNQSS